MVIDLGPLADMSHHYPAEERHSVAISLGSLEDVGGSGWHYRFAVTVTVVIIVNHHPSVKVGVVAKYVVYSMSMLILV